MQRFVTPENKKWWTLGAVSVGLFMIMLDNTVVNVALPAMQRSLNLQLSELEWVVAGYALTFAAFMLTGGKLADYLGRRLIFMVGLGDLHGRLVGVRFRAERRRPDRRPRRPGPRRRADEPGDAVDHHGDLPAAAARHRDRHLGRSLGDGTRDRPARRRTADGARQLELDLLHQRPDRHRRPDRDPVLHRRVARHVARAATRRSWAGHVGDRPVRADLRVHRGEQLRLDLGAHPRLVRGGRRRARHVRAARAAPAAADAQPRALPQPHLQRREHGDALHRARDVRHVLLRLALHAERARLLADPGGCLVPADDAPDRRRSPTGRASSPTASARAGSSGVE